jgi:ribosome-associated toxin RatA of RatAB toxin-antitoxin module
MPRIESTVVVSLDMDRAFRLSQTYGELRYRWDPFVREQRLLDGAETAAKGVQTWTRSRHRLVMVSEYVTYQPPRHVGMRMVKGPWFFKSFSGGWTFTNADRGRTVATWRYNFACRPRWLRPIAHRIGRRVLGRDIRRRLDAFARACADPAIVSALDEADPDPTSSAPAAEPVEQD